MARKKRGITPQQAVEVINRHMRFGPVHTILEADGFMYMFDCVATFDHRDNAPATMAATITGPITVVSVPKKKIIR